MTGIAESRRCLLAVAILASEALVLAIAYLLGVGTPVPLSPSQGMCVTLGGGAPLCAALGAVLAISAMVFAAPFAFLLGTGRIDLATAAARVVDARRPAGFLALHLLGFGILCAPWLLAVSGFPETAAARGGPLWISGAVLSAAGFALWLGEPRRLLASLAPVRLLVLVAPVMIVFASFGAEGPVWAIDWVRAPTFRGTEAFLSMIGETTELHAADIMVIGVGGFMAEVADACSGFSGMAMVSLVTLLYGLASRQRLRFGRVILLIPLAVVLSWIVNIVRIASIMLIGAYISPDLALNAFHSYAGWIAFTVLSACLIVLAETAPWFRRDGLPAARQRTALLSDRVAAEILPFALFLTAGLVVNALFAVPAAGYPVIASIAGLSIAAFRPFYASALRGFRPPAVLGGIAIGILWILGHRGADPVPVADILGAAAPAMVGFWICMRLLGTILFVPLIEEMFFRSYLLRRLSFGGRWGPVAALLLSSAAFAVLHDDRGLAFIAGLVFGALVLRSGRVGDAVAAHMAANATIAFWAVTADDWSVI